MRKLYTVLFVLAVALTVAQTAVAAGAQNFAAVLSGSAEVPPVTTNTAGTARFQVNADQTAIEFELEITDAAGLLGTAGAHIHCAPAGSNGPVVAFLALPVAGGVTGDVSIDGTLTDADINDVGCGSTVAELVEAIEAGGAYVNAHSLAYPGGEIRGQIGMLMYLPLLSKQ